MARDAGSTRVAESIAGCAPLCLDAGTGDTVWEQRYQSGFRDRHVRKFGEGPNSTPLIAGDLLFTIGGAGKMHALMEDDGKVAWSHDLWGEGFGGNLLGHGYSSSPVAYRDMVIVPVGGENAGLVAFHQENGSVKWQALSFKNSYSSPRIMNLVGEQQLVVFMAEELIGIDPASGELRWRYPHVNQWRHNITMPAVAGGDTVSSPPSRPAPGVSGWSPTAKRSGSRKSGPPAGSSSTTSRPSRSAIGSTAPPAAWGLRS